MDHLPPLHRRRAAVLAALTSTLLLAGCAADDREKYPHLGQSEGWTAGSVARTVLLYVLLPVGLCALISVIAWLPGAARRYRYRPQEGWSAEPVWFAGPTDDPVEAVQRAQPGDVVRGGAGGSW
ncbi:MAG: hypothetical protein ACLGIG_11940 [Actinomycetes bacterium]